MSTLYLNDQAKLKHEPLFRNLLDLARKDAEGAVIEIGNAVESANCFSDREIVIYLMGTLNGICSRTWYGSHEAAINELDVRIRTFFNNGVWNYRSLFR